MLKPLKSQYIFLLFIAALFIGCDEDMTQQGLQQNYDTDRYNPNFSEKYAPIPAKKLENPSVNEDDFKEDFTEVLDNGLADYVNNKVTPYQGKLPCDYGHIAPADIAEYDEKKECIPYNKDQFGANGGAELAAYIKKEARKGTKAKKAAFYRAFGPLAVKMQDETGYPASALLSQWASETGWGINSKLLRQGNGIGGHSCFKRQDVVHYPVFRVPGTKGPGNIKASCTYRRPSREGHYYLTFETLEDSAYAQVQNILFNPRVEKNYGNARMEVFSNIKNQQKPNPYNVIDGLQGYAAFPPEYLEELKKRVKNDDLQNYDNLTICQSKAEEVEKVEEEVQGVESYDIETTVLDPPATLEEDNSNIVTESAIDPGFQEALRVQRENNNESGDVWPDLIGP